MICAKCADTVPRVIRADTVPRVIRADAAPRVIYSRALAASHGARLRAASRAAVDQRSAWGSTSTSTYTPEGARNSSRAALTRACVSANRVVRTIV